MWSICIRLISSVLSGVRLAAGTRTVVLLYWLFLCWERTNNAPDWGSAQLWNAEPYFECMSRDAIASNDNIVSAIFRVNIHQLLGEQIADITKKGCCKRQLAANWSFFIGRCCTSALIGFFDTALLQLFMCHRMIILVEWPAGFFLFRRFGRKFSKNCVTSRDQCWGYQHLGFYFKHQRYEHDTTQK